MFSRFLSALPPFLPSALTTIEILFCHKKIKKNKRVTIANRKITRVSTIACGIQNRRENQIQNLFFLFAFLFFKCFKIKYKFFLRSFRNDIPLNVPASYPTCHVWNTEHVDQRFQKKKRTKNRIKFFNKMFSHFFSQKKRKKKLVLIYYYAA